MKIADFEISAFTDFLNNAFSPFSDELIVFRFLVSVMVLCTENHCMLDFKDNL